MECFQNILLGPPAPQPEILGTQLWPNGLGWSLCSRGPWMGVGAWLEVRKAGQAEGGPWEGTQGGLGCCKEAGATVIGQLKDQV